MSDGGVRAALRGSMEPAEWYALLNSMVFFWPSKSRLKTMISAKAYRNLQHDVLIVQTEALVSNHADKLRLSPINSGCTKPFPHPRSGKIFKPAEQYPFDDRKTKYGVNKAVAEVCFVKAIPDIERYVIDVKQISAADIDSL